jgi:hypothetical protein
MSEQRELKTADERVAFLMENIPAARHNYVYLVLSYWQIFDDIEIPEVLLQQMTERVTQPETISRARRKVLEQHRLRQYLQLQGMLLAKDQV